MSIYDHKIRADQTLALGNKIPEQTCSLSSKSGRGDHDAASDREAAG